ncbi:unnamed protein product [Albugo candida]|uniref:Uncharacterized protein n=1 Tax=Albugo candida TaxID=65357 RepID=A0A024FSW5_9STRA|nr:unnamed protein product [Albugo candida]|eukprot:CCI10133.1 unnamed protein product [Albugo candida]
MSRKLPAWCQSQREKVLTNATSSGYAGISASEINTLYNAIKLNQIRKVREFLDKYPHALYIKSTALYQASFFGQHAIVQLMLERGADNNLLSNGLRPVDVAAYGQRNLKNRMKCLHALGALQEPHVVIWSNDVRSNGVYKGNLCSFHIQFSEAIDEFIAEDIEIMGTAEIQDMKMLQKDLFVLVLHIHGSGLISLHIPEKAATRLHRSKNAAPKVYSAASDVFSFTAALSTSHHKD